MSISTTGKSPIKKSILAKQFSLSITNIKKTINSFIKAFSRKTLEAILIIVIITTAIGESLGRNYGLKWYVLIMAILIIYFLKEIFNNKINIEKKV